MSWMPVISSENVVAIHAILVPTVNGDGEILMVGGDNHSYAGNNPGPPPHHDYNHSRRFNCRSRTMIAAPVDTPDFDLFCCGHAFLGDGRPLLAGGTAEFPADAAGIHHTHHFDGHRHGAIYNYVSHTLAQSADMNHAPGLTVGGGRWYPTLCTLGNGDVFIFQGHPEGDDPRHGNNTPERYEFRNNRWVLLPPIGTITGDPILYPRMHVLLDGRIIVTTIVNGYSNLIKINPYTGAVESTTITLPNGRYWGFDCPSVLLPLKPDDGYTAHILLCGGEESQLLTLDSESPTWSVVSRDGNPSGAGRTHSCATILPTGEVLLTGGANPANDGAGVMEPEIYNPSTNQWHIIHEPATVLRNYHSTALLMPDGRVWTGGGNLVGTAPDGSDSQPAHAPTAEQKKIEIYNPPYPAGTRPTISSCPASASYGQRITVGVPNAAQIRKVILIRCGSSTHAYNPDQRAVYLNFDASGASSLIAILPTNPNVLIPGPYMLFVLDEAGRPCAYAKFIRIAFQSCEVITDRSTFSKLEVDAQTTGTALFQRAFYVVYDGFLPSELGSFTTAPAVHFHYANPAGATVPGMTAALADIEYEDASLPPDIPQKVTFVFDVQFANNHAFNFTESMRDVRIDASIGQNSCQAIINLTKARNPYMVDGTTSWLSVDLRVFQIKEGQVRATIAQHASGPNFISALLDRFNAVPDNDYHPFKSISIDQEDSRLELSETVGGVRVFNYAIAKVRYKAPIPITGNNDAQNVKVFFRLFNTASTALQFNSATTYNRTPGADPISLIGKEGGAISSIPFFAAPRVNYGTVSMTAQTDNKNKQSLPANNAVETVRYFGCWLDINQTVPLIPLNPTNDGPFSSGRLPVQQLIRGVHQCLVAEVFFAGDLTPPGATPASSDNLSQRNLAIVESDNPGSETTHTVQHTFEIRPSQFKLPASHATGVTAEQLFIENRDLSYLKPRQITGPDLLIIHRGNLPAESKLSLYMPDIQVDEITALESFTRFSLSKINKDDQHTLSFSASDVNYVPIPGGFQENIPGLLTVQLPLSVVKGQLFKVLVQQARYIRDSLRIIGSFQVNIPVSTAPLMLAQQMRELAVLKHIHQAIPVTDSWHLVFNKYIKGLSDKVDGLGGDASNVPASPDDRWLDYADPTGVQPETPSNLTDIVDEIKNTIHCIGRQSKNVKCIRVKGITIEIKFKDDCC